MFVDLDWPLNASSLLSASAELLVNFTFYFLPLTFAKVTRLHSANNLINSTALFQYKLLCCTVRDRNSGNFGFLDVIQAFTVSHWNRGRALARDPPPPPPPPPGGGGSNAYKAYIRKPKGLTRLFGIGSVSLRFAELSSLRSQIDVIK